MDLDHVSFVATGIQVGSYQVAGLSSTPTKVKLQATQGASFDGIMDRNPRLPYNQEVLDF